MQGLAALERNTTSWFSTSFRSSEILERMAMLKMEEKGGRNGETDDTKAWERVRPLRGESATKVTSADSAVALVPRGLSVPGTMCRPYCFPFSRFYNISFSSIKSTLTQFISTLRQLYSLQSLRGAHEQRHTKDAMQQLPGWLTKRMQCVQVSG